MALVDYASDSDSDPNPKSEPRSEEDNGPDHSDSHPPPAKRVKRTEKYYEKYYGRSALAPAGRQPQTKTPSSPSSSSLPPLPAAFLDLYASTVRTSTADDPSLHQGRVRQIPHVAGNWPSHVYIEWYPPAAAHALLTSLLSDLQKRAGPSTQISTFLTSDLGVPLPLHISLSRPISLSTAEKDGFLAQLVASISRGSVAPFELSCRGVEWHRTEESGRSFLVLRVQSSSNSSNRSAGDDDLGSDDDTNTTDKNPELTELLRRCNLAAGSHGQPQLYQWATTARDSSAGVERESSKQPKSANVWDAFHLSIAWSFAKPTEELKQVTQAAFSENGGSAKRICETKIPVEGVKVKIGNVVTHVPLPQPGRRTSKPTRNFLGLS